MQNQEKATIERLVATRIMVGFRASATITKAKIKSPIKGGRRTVKEYKKKEAKRCTVIITVP